MVRWGRRSGEILHAVRSYPCECGPCRRRRFLRALIDAAGSAIALAFLFIAVGMLLVALQTAP